MIIDRKPLGLEEFVKAEIFPFAEDRSQTVYQDSIRVGKNNSISWKRQEWTASEIMEYFAKLQAGFAAAFRIAEEDAL